MAVSNEHLNSTVQVWDGLTFSSMDKKDATKLERDGLVQITANLQASQLKSAAEFNKVREARAAKELEDELKMPAPGRATKKTYNTRQMKSKD